MTARVLTIDELDVAAGLLAHGGVVAIPTDTVYGLAASLCDDAAVARLTVLKQRRAGLPIAVLCATAEEAAGIAAAWPAAAATLAARFWPGPLTIVVPVPDELAQLLGSQGTAGLRVPADDVCRALLVCTGPLAVTSANLHGAAPATSAESVLEVFKGAEIDAVLDGGRHDGAVSTVVHVAGAFPLIVREGAIAGAEVLGALR